MFLLFLLVQWNGECELVCLTESALHVFQLHSDFDDGDGNIIYYLEGIGANQHPFNVFVIDQITGDIRVTKILDRELIDTYNVSYTSSVHFIDIKIYYSQMQHINVTGYSCL